MGDLLLRNSLDNRQRNEGVSMTELRKLFTTIHSGCMDTRFPNINQRVNLMYNFTVRRVAQTSDN